MPAYAAPAASVMVPSTPITTTWGKLCRSPVTGLVITVNVAPGQTVEPNDVLVVVEAMKMENQVTATHAATVKSVNVVPGNSVKVHQVLLEFES